MTGLPDPRFDHVLRLTDPTGVLEHARYSIPRRSHGYTVDDNARALMVAARANDETLDRLARVSLSLISRSLDAQGRVRNRLSTDGIWSQLATAGDPLGRAWQGLGAAVGDGPRWLAEAALDTVGGLGYVDPEPLRPTVFASLGAAALLATDPSIPSAQTMADRARRHLLYAPAQWGPVARTKADLCQRPGP